MQQIFENCGATFKNISREEYEKMFPKRQVIGQGSFGKVYKSERDNEMLALKEFKNLTKNNILRIIAQTTVISEFTHPNLISIIDAYYILLEGQSNSLSKVILVTPYCEHGDLICFSSRLRASSFSKKIYIALQVSRGIRELHSKGYMHRDIKPHNILVTGKLVAKLGDFGLIKLQNSLQNTANVGTPSYSDPLVGTGHYSLKCDIFSLGLVIYYIFQQEHLFPLANNANMDFNKKRFLSKRKDLIEAGNYDSRIKPILLKTLTSNEKERGSADQIVNMLEKIYKQTEKTEESEILPDQEFDVRNRSTYKAEANELEQHYFNVMNRLKNIGVVQQMVNLIKRISEDFKERKSNLVGLVRQLEDQSFSVEGKESLAFYLLYIYICGVDLKRKRARRIARQNTTLANCFKNVSIITYNLLRVCEAEVTESFRILQDTGKRLLSRSGYIDKYGTSLLCFVVKSVVKHDESEKFLMDVEAENIISTIVDDFQHFLSSHREMAKKYEPYKGFAEQNLTELK